MKIKKKELIYTWIKHENIILSERKQTKSHILNDLHIKYKKRQIHRNKKLNAGSYFIAQDEGMTESPVETLEKAIVLHHFWTEGLTSF